MQVMARFRGIDPDEVGADLVARLREIYSDNRPAKYAYLAVIDVEDPRYQLLMDQLSSAGLRPWMGVFERQKGLEYSFELERIYEPSDFEGCRYAQFVPRYVDKLYAGQSDGIMQLNRGVLRSKESFLQQAEFYASDRAKRLLEAESFIGLSFKPTRLRQRIKRGREEDEICPEISWESFGPPWWQMVCERKMPRLSPSMTLVDGRGGKSKIVHPPVDLEWSYSPKEGLYTPVEWHYRAEDIAAAEPFDYAEVLEHVGGGGTIVSKQFYDFCQAHDLQADWVPVRIDEGL